MSNLKKWNAQVQFPSDSSFVNRITNAIFGPSASSGNPMVTLTCEVVSPTEYEIGGENYNIAGVETKNYYSTATNGDEAKTATQQKAFAELWALLGLDPTTINWDNIDPSPLKGKLILTRMESEEQQLRKNPTKSQIEAAKAQGIKDFRNIGDQQKHPVTGKVLVNYWPKIREIFALAPNQDSVAATY